MAISAFVTLAFTEIAQRTPFNGYNTGLGKYIEQTLRCEVFFIFDGCLIKSEFQMSQAINMSNHTPTYRFSSICCACCYIKKQHHFCIETSCKALGERFVNRCKYVECMVL